MAEDFVVSYDILDWFPILYCKNVFKYLDVKDIIQASAVNKEWNKLAAESAQVNDIKLIFDNISKPSLIEEAVRILKNSPRNYQKIEFKRTSTRASGLLLEILADRAGSWKSVSLKQCGGFEQDKTCQIFLQIIEPSVEELFISQMQRTIRGRSTVNVDSQFTFPHLKVLRWTLDFKYFTHCKNLVEISGSSFRGRSEENQDQLRVLLNNHNLKDLSVLTDGTLFEHSFEFELQKLRIYDHLGHLYSVRVLENFHSFLETQSQTLEALKINTKLNQACMELILGRMPRLTSLEVGNGDRRHNWPILTWGQALPLNTTVTHLSLQGRLGDCERAPFEILIRALPSLKHFCCQHLDDETFSQLVSEVPALESLEIGTCEVSRFPDGNIFPSIKSFKAFHFSNHLVEPTGENNFAVLVRKEMRKKI